MMKIPYMILLFMGLMFVYMFFFGGLGNLQAEIDESQKNSFRRATVMENLLSVQLEEPENYFSHWRNSEERRAILSEEFFLEENEGQTPGYQTRNGHCYIERVAGLDGISYGFYLEPTTGEEVDELGCTAPQNPTLAVSSPALLLRTDDEEGRLPVRIFVYQIAEPDFMSP